MRIFLIFTGRTSLPSQKNEKQISEENLTDEKVSKLSVKINSDVTIAKPNIFSSVFYKRHIDYCEKIRLTYLLICGLILLNYFERWYLAMKKLVSILLSLFFLAGISVPALAVERNEESFRMDELRRYADMDPDTADEATRERILQAREEIIFSSKGWTADGTVAYVMDMETGEILEFSPWFSDVFPGWDMPRPEPIPEEDRTTEPIPEKPLVPVPEEAIIPVLPHTIANGAAKFMSSTRRVFNLFG